MLYFIIWVLPTIIKDSWLLQGLIVNAIFTIGSIPFTNMKIRNMFKNRKKKRIENAQDEHKYCVRKKCLPRKKLKKVF